VFLQLHRDCLCSYAEHPFVSRLLYIYQDGWPDALSFLAEAVLPNPDWLPSHPRATSTNNNPFTPSTSSLTSELVKGKDWIAVEIAKAEEAIKELKGEVEQIWEDDRQVEYELASAFMHRGDASFGHCKFCFLSPPTDTHSLAWPRSRLTLLRFYLSRLPLPTQPALQAGRVAQVQRPIRHRRPQRGSPCRLAHEREPVPSRLREEGPRPRRDRQPDAARLALPSS
jgi:hypothetical protein